MNLVQRPEAAGTMIPSAALQGSNWPFCFTVVYLLLEFGRPQEVIPGLAALSVPGTVSVLLAVSLGLSGRPMFSDKATQLFILLLAFMALHIPLALNNYAAFQTAKVMGITFVAYLGIVTSVDTFDRIQTLITLWFVIHAYLAIYGIIKGGRGIGGFLGDENDLAMTLNMIIPFAFFLALAEENPIKKVWYIGITALFLLTNMMTFSRGGFVGLVAVGLYCWIRSPKKLVAAVLLCLLALFMVFYAPDKYGDRLRSMAEDSTGTGEDRLYMWRFGWKMFLDNPVIGVGQGNFPVEFGNYERDERLYGRTRVWRAAHSLYFTLLPELGLVGGFIFFKMLSSIKKDLTAIRRSTLQGFKKTQKAASTILPLTYAMEASLIGFLVSSIFLSTLYYPNFWVLMGFVVALRKVTAAKTSIEMG
jgi:probable O-glycosylation ligase (exosortase A-associated)